MQIETFWLRCENSNFLQNALFWVLETVMPETVTPFPISQPVITCLKLTIKTLEKGVEYVQSQQQKHQNNTNGIVLVFSLLTLKVFQTLF